MFAVFPTMRHLHELLWYLTQARDLPAAAPLHDRLDGPAAETRRLTDLPAEELARVDVDAHRTSVVPLLRQASELAGRGCGKRQPFQSRDVIGKDLRRADLRGADLRGASAVGADLRGADLTAPTSPARTCAAPTCGAPTSRRPVPVQSQLDAARGDATTRLPAAFSRPAHWTDHPAEHSSRSLGGPPRAVARPRDGRPGQGVADRGVDRDPAGEPDRFQQPRQERRRRREP